MPVRYTLEAMTCHPANLGCHEGVDFKVYMHQHFPRVTYVLVCDSCMDIELGSAPFVAMNRIILSSSGRRVCLNPVAVNHNGQWSIWSINQQSCRTPPVRPSLHPLLTPFLTVTTRVTGLSSLTKPRSMPASLHVLTSPFTTTKRHCRFSV